MADTKITDMTAATALDRADLVAVVQDVATTPVNRSATLDVLDPGNALSGTAATADGTAVHPGSETTLARTVAVGDGTWARRADSVAIGHNAQASDGTAGEHTIVGSAARSTNNRATVVGYDGQAGQDAVAIGHQASATHGFSVALGQGATTTATNQVMVGSRDIEITGTTRGLVLEDRTLGTRHRVYLDNGALTIEAA